MHPSPYFRMNIHLIRLQFLTLSTNLWLHFKKLFSISSFVIFCFSILFFFFSFLLRSLLLNILPPVHLRGKFFKFSRKLILYKIVNYRDEMGTVFSGIFFIRIDLNNIIQRGDRDGFLRDIFHQDRSKQYNRQMR